MDDSTDVDLVDVPPIGSPDRFQITVKQLWRAGQPHSDAENEDIGNAANDSDYPDGPLQLLPFPSGGFRRLKPLTLDTNLPPPFLLSPGYPSTAGSTLSPSSYTPDYFDIRDESLLPPAKLDDDMRFRPYPHFSIYDPDDFEEAYAWDVHPRFPAFWDTGDEFDAPEPSDGSADYITFTGQSASIPPGIELGFRPFDLSEPSSFVFDFPEDVGESLEHDTVLTDGDSDMIDLPGRLLVPASEIPVELSVHPDDDSQTLPVFSPDILLPRMGKLSEDSGELESVQHLRYPELDVTDVPINVPLSPFIVDGFPGDTTPLSSDLAGGEADGISMDTDWLGGSLGGIICTPCLGEELMEWDRWRGQIVEELDRDLDSWAEVRRGSGQN